MLRLTNVVKHFGDRVILNQVNFSLPAGQKVEGLDDGMVDLWLDQQQTRDTDDWD